MRKNSVILTTLSVLSTFFVLSNAHADIEWSGVYRIEGNFLKNSELSAQDRELTYGLHHLVLRPKIVAGDGITIYGQFDILNASTAYPDSQIGQIWGNGVRDGNAAGTTTSATDANTLSQTQNAEMIEVSQLYLTLAHEYGQLIVGRAPLHFGLGMTHNAGRGLFDHYYDTRDLVGYKFVVGNLYFLPMFGKPSENKINVNDDLNDYMIQMQYENPETDLELGVFYQIRSGGDQASDFPSTSNPPGPDGPPGAIGGPGSTQTSGVDIKTVNMYALRESENLRLGIEASFQTGETGVQTAGGENVSVDAFGIAGELEWRPEGSKWKWGLKAGTATGDDPATNGKYEGYVFDRNYDVAMLMFNHPLGREDFFRTDVMTGGVRTGDDITKADVEAISNVFYIAPSFKYTINDRWNVDNTLITGWLGANPIAGADIAKDIGYEWDISVNFSPRKGVMWVNQVGLLLPGSMWEADGLHDSNMGFGLQTKAAISF